MEKKKPGEKELKEREIKITHTKKEFYGKEAKNKARKRKRGKARESEEGPKRTGKKINENVGVYGLIDSYSRMKSAWEGSSFNSRAHSRYRRNMYAVLID